MSPSIQMLLIVLAWGFCLVVVTRICVKSREGSVGLPLAYLLAMTFLHVGSISYIDPGYSANRHDSHWYLTSMNFTSQMVLDGTLASFLTVVGILAGCLLFRGGRAVNSAVIATPPNRNPMIFNLLILSSLGFVGGFIAIASVQSIFVVLRNLAIVAICLGLWISMRRLDHVQFTRWVMVSAAIPVVYLIVYGFFSYAFIALSIIYAFWLSVPKPKAKSSPKQTLVTIGATYITFSLFVSWMEVRDRIRGVIWSDYGRADRLEESTFGERFTAVFDALGSVRLFNPFDYRHLDWLNVRLNQNIFIGKAMDWHQIHPGLDLNGSSLLLALVGWVPRFLWSTKPEMGGSGFVAEHTGSVFSDAVAIASGPTFEFVINFGLIGALFGGVALGALLRWIDRNAARSLRDMDYARFIRAYLIGLALVAPGSQMFFIIALAASSWIVGTGIMFWMKTNKRRDPTLLVQPTR